MSNVLHNLIHLAFTVFIQYNVHAYVNIYFNEKFRNFIILDLDFDLHKDSYKESAIILF